MFWNCFPYTDFHELNADWIIRHFKEFKDFIKSVDSWIDEHEKDYDELKEICDNLNNGTLTPALENSLKLWINKNLETLIGNAIKMVMFGLENGYFVAYIPDSWSDIIFGTTGLDDFPSDYEFGHLTLTY